MRICFNISSCNILKSLKKEDFNELIQAIVLRAFNKYDNHQ